MQARLTNPLLSMTALIGGFLLLLLVKFVFIQLIGALLIFIVALSPFLEDLIQEMLTRNKSVGINSTIMSKGTTSRPKTNTSTILHFIDRIDVKETDNKIVESTVQGREREERATWAAARDFQRIYHSNDKKAKTILARLEGDGLTQEKQNEVKAVLKLNFPDARIEEEFPDPVITTNEQEEESGIFKIHLELKNTDQC